jgi:hypothetical protein
MRLIIGALAAALSIPALAEELKLDCFTERVWLSQGVPAVILATFDEDRKTAGLFAKEFGGIRSGTDVMIAADAVMFKFTTGDGSPGEVLITRTTGTMMIQIAGAPALKFLATCQRSPGRRF